MDKGPDSHKPVKLPDPLKCCVPAVCLAQKSVAAKALRSSRSDIKMHIITDSGMIKKKKNANLLWGIFAVKCFGMSLYVSSSKRKPCVRDVAHLTNAISH